MVAIEDSSDGGSGRYPGRDMRCAEASSAASLRDIAEEFFLKANLDFGISLVRVVASSSFRALIA